jgi:hypothetical protein
MTGDQSLSRSAPVIKPIDMAACIRHVTFASLRMT